MHADSHHGQGSHHTPGGDQPHHTEPAAVAREHIPIGVGVVTIIDRGARGERPDDLSGQAIKDNLHRFGGTLRHYEQIPDEQEIIRQTLVPENQWNNSSFTNQVGVEEGIGTGAGRSRGVVTGRFQFSQPFDGPGTAHNYTPTLLESTTATVFPTSLALAPAVDISSQITLPGGGQLGVYQPRHARPG